MDEEARLHPSVHVAEALQDLCPAVDPLHVRLLEPDAQPGVLRRHGAAVALTAEHVRAGHEAVQVRQFQRARLP